MQNSLGNDGHFIIALDTSTETPMLRGELSVYVPCGSQLAYWAQFPGNIEFSLKNESGETLSSMPGLSSVCYDLLEIEYYAAQPCNQVVTEEFEIALKKLFWELPENLTGFDIRGEFSGLRSNIVKIK
ncbi:MAG: hypothetical protein P8179_24070 [Candidatus Thiodiazotropha sp.]